MKILSQNYVKVRGHQRGFLIADLVVGISILAVAVLSLAFSFARQNPLI